MINGNSPYRVTSGEQFKAGLIANHGVKGVDANGLWGDLIGVSRESSQFHQPVRDFAEALFPDRVPSSGVVNFDLGPHVEVEGVGIDLNADICLDALAGLLRNTPSCSSPIEGLHVVLPTVDPSTLEATRDMVSAATGEETMFVAAGVSETDLMHL